MTKFVKLYSMFLKKLIREEEVLLVTLFFVGAGED